MREGLIRIEDAVMALNEDVAWLESEGAIGIDIVEMRNRVLEWLYELPTVPQKEYTEQQIRDTFNSGFSCGMEREWIDTEEEMPIDGEEVLVSVYWKEYGDTILAYGHYSPRFDKWKLYSDSEGELIKGYDVIAWMPLPYPCTADRKTENSSEKPNNCEDLQDWKDKMWSEAIVTEPQTELVRVKYHCINCAENGSYKCSKCDGEMYYKYDKDEPQTSKIIEAYSKGFKDGADAVKAMPSTECRMCKHFKDRPNCGWECEYDTFEECRFEPKDEPKK